jgi:hypothetical protein
MPRSATLPTRLPHRNPRLTRSARIPLRWRLRAIGRALLQLVREIVAAPGYRRGREDFLQIAAREARERSEAIDGSVGAMSAADIRRIAEATRRERDQTRQ